MSSFYITNGVHKSGEFSKKSEASKEADYRNERPFPSTTKKEDREHWYVVKE